MLDYLRDLGRRLKGRFDVEVWCTNLEYDLFNVFGPERIREVHLRFGRSALVGGKWRGENVHFRDTVRHLPLSVEELGKLVGLEKVNLTLRRSRMLERCQRDAAITYRTACLLSKVYGRFRQLSKLTLASTAYHIWANRYFKSPVRAVPDEVWNLGYSAYHGGRTEAFSLGHFKGVHVIDVASMFPWAMQAAPFPLPWGPFQRWRQGDAATALGLYRARVEVPADMVPLLPLRTPEGTIYPVGTFAGDFTGEELVHAAAHGSKVEIQSGITFLTTVTPFKGYVADMFRRKARARGGMRTAYKLLLNALYGKFGQRGETVRAVPTETFAAMENPPDKFRVWNGLCFFTEHSRPPPWSNMVWAAIVTARARIRLHTEITRLRAAGCRVLYCDTDSVMFLPPASGRGPRYPVKAKLGGFELRGEYRELLVIGKKEYGLRLQSGAWEPHIKGVPKKQRMRYLRTGKAEFDRPVKMRESSRLGIGANVWRTVRKSRGELNKGRTRNPDGSLPPVVIRDQKGNTHGKA